jgi:centromere/kinetochore protein ZW10
MPQHLLLIALGQLFQHILNRLEDEIFKLNDITEIESKRLYDLLNFNTTQSIFDYNEHNYISHYCKNYNRFKMLVQLLLWSFSDIMTHFRMGALTDFEVPQLVFLVKALFSDSELRKRNIIELERGHPQ